MKDAGTRVTTGGLCLALWAAVAIAPAARAADVGVVPLLEKPEAAGPQRTLRIFGARNGVFSGKIVAPLGTRASAPVLGGPGELPVSAVQVLYQHPDGPNRYSRSQPIFNGLHPDPPGAMAPSRHYKPYAVQPIWLIVRVPADAAAGAYVGTWRVGGADVKVELDVADFRIPDALDFATHAGFIQSPESVAMQYGVAMWSNQHWKLIDKSFQRLGELGAKSLYIPLQRRTHFGNPHSMVRWIPKGEGTYEHDFSLVERYVATAVKRLGKIPMVCLVAWEINAPGAANNPSGLSAAQRQKDREILITVKNGEKLEEAAGPQWGTPQCATFWKPVFDGIRKILAGHGIADSMMVGIVGDYRPSAEAIADLAAASPGTKWVAHAHGLLLKVGDVPTGLAASVWGIGGMRDPAETLRWKWQRPRYYGWQKKFRLVVFPRYGCMFGNVIGPRSPQPLAMYRSLAEGAIVSKGQAKFSPGCKGFDRFGADFWPALKDKRGRGSTIDARYPETAWGQLRISYATAAILAPGEDGAVITDRFQMLREGLQEVEARIFIEKALLGKTLEPEMADRLQKMLDDRIRGFLKAVVGKGKGWIDWARGDWQARSAELYAAAAEVAKALKE